MKYKSLKMAYALHILMGIGLLIHIFLASCTSDQKELTFYALSDIHYGAQASSQDESPIVQCPKVNWINNLPGAEYPDVVGNHTVKKPRGIIMAGDMINDGARAEKAPKQWENYIADFGVNGEGRCKFPVYEGFGNHDVSEKRFIENKIKERNQQRMDLGYISNLSENGYHYSWDWETLTNI